MAEKSRYPHVNEELCIGCSACSSVCDRAVIEILRDDSLRIIRFRHGCPENCDVCLNSCPVGALNILDEKDKSEDWFMDVAFNMRSCYECVKYFATDKMIEHVRSKTAMDGEWFYICPSCRQQLVAKTMRSSRYG